MIHHTMGVYANETFKTNGVPSEKIAGHIAYNLAMRPGRGFFVDGVCLNKGYLTDEQVSHFEKLQLTLIKSNPNLQDTAPYV